MNDRRIANEAGSNIHSLYIQDQWSIGNRLTLNLGIRTENEKVPTFRPDYSETAIHFNLADKLAPRFGAAYDVFADGRLKVFGSWGLYYDWTKYELPRGSFGAETWCIDYRGLDTLDLGSLNLSNMPGPGLVGDPGQLPRPSRALVRSTIDPDIEPMRQSSASGGIEFQMNRNSVLTVHYIHNELLETIEDIGFLNDEGDEGYLIGNPGKAPGGHPVLRPADAARLSRSRARSASTTRSSSASTAVSANYFLQRELHPSRLYGNYAGIASSDEVSTPTTGGTSSATAQQQAGSIARPGGNVNRAWDLDELMCDSRGNLDVRGRLATDRPHVVKLYGAYTSRSARQIGASFYGASGTPISTYVTSTHGADVFVNGRGDMGRTPIAHPHRPPLSHELAMAAAKRMRFELNVLNLFNQKTVRHLSQLPEPWIRHRIVARRSST